MSKDEFRLLKDRLYRANNSLELALKSYPKFQSFAVNWPDGRRVDAMQVLAWFDVLRSELWKEGPPEVQERKVREIVQQQPHG